ncbi:unnamed protein product [Amoebophrya sp. A120]|nr:unnamed protein product [Amoebophrya sp. A120]|eukprot:GSA120T00002615001.1
MSILAEFGFGGFHDCERSTNLLANLYTQLLCEMKQKKWNGRRMVEQVPEVQNCNTTDWIFEKSTRNWMKCCSQKLGMMTQGDYLCQHVEPLYQLPPMMKTKDSLMTKVMKGMLLMLNGVLKTKGEGVRGPDRPPREEDSQSDEGAQLCFQTARPGRYLQEGCYCHRGMEECIDTSEQGMFFF